MIFENKLPVTNRNAVIEKFNSVSTYLGIDPNWLAAVISFESNFSTSIQNPYTNAVGIIQFTRDSGNVNYKTIAGTKYYIEDIKKMDFIQQLELARLYYSPYKGKIKGFHDLYLATFFPIAIGKPDSWILETNTISAKAISNANPIFDTNKLGYVTVGAIKAALLKKIPTQYVSYLIDQPVVKKTAITSVIIGAIVLGYFIFKK